MGHQWLHDIIDIAAVLIPLFLYHSRVNREQRKETEAMHEQNTETLKALVDEQNLLPQHFHTERSGPLTAEGIIRKPRS